MCLLTSSMGGRGGHATFMLFANRDLGIKNTGNWLVIVVWNKIIVILNIVATIIHLKFIIPASLIFDANFVVGPIIEDYLILHCTIIKFAFKS